MGIMVFWGREVELHSSWNVINMFFQYYLVLWPWGHEGQPMYSSEFMCVFPGRLNLGTTLSL